MKVGLFFSIATLCTFGSTTLYAGQNSINECPHPSLIQQSVLRADVNVIDYQFIAYNKNGKPFESTPRTDNISLEEFENRTYKFVSFNRRKSYYDKIKKQLFCVYVANYYIDGKYVHRYNLALHSL